MHEPSSHSPEIQSKYSEISDYLRVLRRRKWSIILCLIGVVIPVTLVTQLMTPVYEAEASIIYREPKDLIFALDMGRPRYDNSALVNLTEVLKSRKLAEEVADSLPAEVILKFDSPRPSLPAHSQKDFFAGQLQKDLRVIPVQSSDILRIKVQASSPIVAKVIANVYVERTIEWNLRTKREEITSVREFVETQLAVFQDKLKAAEDTLRAFKEKNKMISISDSHTKILSQMTDVEVRYNETQAEFAAMKQRQGYNEQKIKRLAPTYTPAPSPLEMDLETSRAKQQELKKIIANYDEKLQSLPAKELILARLVRNRDVNEKIYSMLLEKREEVRITEASKIGDIHVVDAAQEPIKPIKPSKKKNLAVGLFLGLALGVGLAFFLESLDTSLKSPEDVKKYIEFPVLASIPSISSNDASSVAKAWSLVKKNKQATGQSYSMKLFSQFAGSTHIYEAYRALEINFNLINTNRVLKTILVTSPSPEEGKTLTAINMAQAFSKIGIKNLLIDCDLRRPMIHKILDGNMAPGLTNVLVNETALEQAIQSFKNISFLSCGTLPPNPSELLNTPRMREVLAELKNKYDLIILDSPPLIAVTDSIVLSTEVDGVCLVIKSRRTKQEAALRAKQLLENSRSRIIGIILNDVDLKDMYGYYKDYYYYSNNGQKRKKHLSRNSN